MFCQSPRDLPSVNSLLEQPEVRALGEQFGETLVKSAVQEVLARWRARLLNGDRSVDLEQLLPQTRALVEPAQRRVLNLTGTVLHTNLGRAPLGDLLSRVADRLRGYSVLEFDLATGKRGQRGLAVERLLRWATGAQAALLVNNCSAAMILLLTVLAKDREVIVSRGELVEIGGGFRIPDILALSGARLVEVGTTNRTRISDYERAISENTGLLLSTHRSNFEIVGFAQSPTRAELVALGRQYRLPVVYDLGSGMLSSVVRGEPSVSECGDFDLTAFSGDKLLGGPQCGVLMGQTELVEACRRHPLYRAFRCDKVTLALMEEAIRGHLRDPAGIPTLALLSQTADTLRPRAENLSVVLKEVLPSDYLVEVIESVAKVGGGSLPGGELPSVAVRVVPPREGDLLVLQNRLREAPTPIIVRLEKGAVWLDLLSLPQSDDEELYENCRRFFT